MNMHFQFVVILLFALMLVQSAHAGGVSANPHKGFSCKSFEELALPANPARLSILGRGLGFPFQDTRLISDMRVYGIRPWGFEPVHNGIDIIIDNTGAVLDVGDRALVISIVDGTVKWVMPSDERGSMMVVVEVNPAVYVTYNFEPQTTIPGLRALQAGSIQVVAGQRIKKGQKIGYLVAGEGEDGGSATGSGNPHIDLRLLLIDPAILGPDPTFEELLGLEFSHNDTGQLPTFLCPYDYSSTHAKYAYEKILKTFDSATQCKCPCRFPYNAEACGAGCVD